MSRSESCKIGRGVLRLGAATCIFCVAIALSALHGFGQAKLQKLGLAEIESLIGHGVPDSTMSTQIQAHGLSFNPTESTVDELRAKGAGPRTLATVRALIGGSSRKTIATRAPASAARERPKITLAQLEQAIRGQSPDQVLAEQIRARGVEFTVKSKTIADLTEKGAKPQTITALREQMRVGSLKVQSLAGAQLTIDGDEVAAAGPDGTAQFSEVEEGDHVLQGSAPGYRNATRSFTIANGETKLVLLPMEWGGGYLTLSVQPQEANVSVTGPTTIATAGVDMRCAPGSYTVVVSKDGYTPQKRTIQVATGEHHNETFSLAIDPAFLARKLDDAKSKLSAGDSAAAERLATAMLEITPDNPDAELVLAESAFQQGDMNRFVDAGAKAIRAGRSVTVRVMHAHTVMRLWIHPVDLTIAQAGIAVVSDPPDKHCKMPASVGFDLIDSAQVVRDPQHGFAELHVQYASKPHGFIVHDLDFLPDGSQTVVFRQPGQVFSMGASNVQEPGNGPQTLEGIFRLLSRSRQ